MGIYHCLCSKNNPNVFWFCKAWNVTYLTRSLFIVHGAVRCVSNQYNTTAKNWSLSSSSHRLQGFRPCDLFWFLQQSRRLLRCHSWLHFPHDWYFVLQCGSLSVSVHQTCCTHLFLWLWIFFETGLILSSDKILFYIWHQHCVYETGFLLVPASLVASVIFYMKNNYL